MDSTVACNCPLCGGMAGNVAGYRTTQDAGEGGTGIGFASTGVYYIDAVAFEMASPVTVWHTASQTPLTRTYKFVQSVPGNRDWASVSGFSPLSAASQTIVRQQFQQYAEVINVRFTEISSSSSTTADISIGSGGFSSGSGGFGQYFYNYSTDSNGTVTSKTLDSLVIFNRAYSLDSVYGRNLVLHELGHAFTLKHPGNYDSGGNSPEGPFLPAAEDNNQYSVMSYNYHPSLNEASESLMPYDIAALQYRFGANLTTRTGDDSYTSLLGRNALTVWDAGGTDSFDFSARSDSLTLDLRAGAFSSIGTANNLAIAYGVVIENAFGGSGNDTLRGNSADNRLSGGAGTDTAVFSNIRSSYQLSLTSAALTVIDQTIGGDGSDTLTGIEYLRFSDLTIAVSSLGTTGTGGSYTAMAYAARNADLFNAFGTDTTALVRHYITNGRGEGRTATGYAVQAYAAMNGDLFTAFGTDTTALVRHYVTNGRNEGRTATGFDAAAYAAMNSDLFSAFGTDVSALTRHYISHGRKEGRAATGFDATAYAAMNSDLFAAFGTDTTALVRHYITNGRAEGRTANGFDATAYAALNSDLFNAFGTDTTSLVRHYVNNGRAEGRTASGATGMLAA